ncbi:hypothetical protein [Aestuariispira insulae]|uniref:Lipoprotein n=1 Tax=Aestuariispira insulae TaxID=1461337 RepID=A0A3D9HW78_9PROT|nr:hypothetical protein [Aestuariispira insulae]RED53752.1 hypothetical protein DFP90_101550 [Aestuariispira insulae]
MYKFNTIKVMSVLLLGLTVAACQTTKVHKADQGVVQLNGSKVLVMPLDVELYELSAAGANEPRADWTQQAEANIKQILDERLGTYSIQVVRSEDLAKSEELAIQEKRVIKFHEVVGNNIRYHKIAAFNNLPTKQDKFDWTLAEKAAFLRDYYDADYALFISVRDSYSSAGRAAIIAIGMVLGVGIQGGQQVGHASLVDLNDGDIEWFNFLYSSTGDLRKKETAPRVVDGLLADFPG